MRRVLRAGLLSVMVWWLAAVPAEAAGDGERVGENIGDLLGGWSKSLFMGIAGLVALIFLLNRRRIWRSSWSRRWWWAGS